MRKRTVVRFLLTIMLLSLSWTVPAPTIATLTPNTTAYAPKSGQGTQQTDGAQTNPTSTVYRAMAVFAPVRLDPVYQRPAEVTHAPATTSIEYELWIEIDYMPGHEPTPYVLTYIHDYYYDRGIEVTFHADLYDEAGNLTYDDPFSQIVPLDESTTDEEFWATEAAYNNHDFGYYSKWKWVLFGATVYGRPDIAGYAYPIFEANDAVAGNYVFMADQRCDDWALANLNETNGVTPQEKVEAVVLMHEMGHTIGILKLRAGSEYYDPDLTSVMSYVNTENCNAVDEYGNPYWHYSDNYWKLRNMEYYVLAVHDVATLNVTASPTSICPGETVAITVEVKNEGEVNETFQETAYYNSTVIRTQWILELAPNSTTVLTFYWNTTSILPANYTISAAADPVPSETDTADNTLVDGTVRVLVRDIAITAVETSSTLAVHGEIFSINVTSANEGEVSETFNVTTYANSTLIGTQTVTALPPGATTTLTFNWDTTSVSLGNYTISATASSVPSETDLADNTLEDGTVEVVVRDVAVLSVTPSSTLVVQGDTVSTDVVVANEGTLTETFDVTAFYDSNPIGTQTVTALPPGATTTLTFNWDTTGIPPATYTISATASSVSGEIDLADNALEDGTVELVVHDMAVLSVIPSATWVVQGDVVSIEVVVANEGTLSETFEVTTYANITVIGTQTVTDLAPNSSTTLTFYWNTTGVSSANYTISAAADPVPGETDTVDNTLVDGTVNVMMRDVAVLSVTPSLMEEGKSIIVMITVEVKNEGTISETFNVTTYANSTVIGTQTVTDLAPNATTTLTYTWKPRRNQLEFSFTISATAGPVPQETDLADNILVDGTISLLFHDVAVLNITTSSTWVYQGGTLLIAVEVKNEGTYKETFNVTTYANSTVIGTQTITVDKFGNATLVFNWNTTGVSPAEYVISATAGPVEGETSLNDNTLEDGTIQVRMPGDLDGDDDVDADDYVLFAGCYPTSVVDPESAKADLDFDGDVDSDDFVLFSGYYGKSGV